ncbi:MAG: mannosyltransferase family protein [Aggregatilineaceae bacterium]
MEPKRPDYALAWTPHETGRTSQNDKPYLIEPFMNRHVSWDSEFYLSIAVTGYDDPAVRLVQVSGQKPLAMNYAFFPLYPLMIRALSLPLRVFGLNNIATATLAGVIVALVGALGGMIALYELVRAELGEDGGVRTAFYLLIFPSGFFLAQVYAEGLFIALAFGSLALAARGRLTWAAILAGLAVWARSIGVLLLIPLTLSWLRQLPHQPSVNGRALARGSVLLIPALAFAVWWLVLGDQFRLVEDHWFGRSPTDWERTRQGWQVAWDSLRSAKTIGQMRAYYALEFASILFALLACLLTLHRYPGPALFGMAVLAVTAGSGAPQSLIRYVLVVPSVFITAGRWGRSGIFDRAWTTASLLLMGLLVTLFTFDMWVA